jgi:hypothetical protein
MYAVTTLGALFIVIAIICVLSGRGFAIPLAISAGLQAASLVNAGGQSVPMFYAVAIAAAAALLVRRSRPGSSPMRKWYAFGAWAFIITLVGPTLFAGVLVLSPSVGVNTAVSYPIPLGWSTSNAAQAVYLVLGLCAATYLYRASVQRWVATLALATPTLLSFAKYACSRAGMGWPAGFFDNNTSLVYIDRLPTGEPRFRGIFAEPSVLATFSTATAFYFLALGLQQRGRRRRASFAVVLMAAINLSVSTSTTAIVAPVLIGCVLVAWLAWRFLTGRLAIAPHTMLVILLGIAVTLWFGGNALLSAEATLRDKLGSFSFFVRSTADLFSLRLIDDSYGLGLGLGSNRPSSFIPSLLSTVGVVGAILFLVATVALCRRAWAVQEARPVVLALVAWLLGRSIAGADLGSPALLWMLIGVLASLAHRPREASAETVDASMDADDRLAALARRVARP